MVQDFRPARGVMGIYTIVHIESGRSYIGSSVNVGERWLGHRSCLRRRMHKNPRLQQAWDEYGEDAFVFTIVEIVASRDQLVATEKVWLTKDGTWKDGVGFNLTGGANGAGNFRTPEQRARQSALMKGVPKTAEHRAKIWATRQVTQEMREQMAANGRMGRGRPKSAEWRRKIGDPQRGSGNHNAKLTETDVIEIKWHLLIGEIGKSDLARAYGISPTTVRNIETGRRWGHIKLTH